jgi:hypothetical protein
VVVGAAGFDAAASLEDAPLFEEVPLEAEPSVPAVVGAGLGAASPLDFFSVSSPFFRPSEG